MESEQLPTPPDETKVETELKIDEATGRKYEYEKDGVKYGGDFLAEPPAEIKLDDELPPAPPETPHPAL
jgi:hypothetical protein